MTIEKSYTEFIVLHEKKIMTKDVSSLESGIKDLTKRASSVIESDTELSEANDKMLEGINILKKILNKHHLYEL